MHVKHFLQQRKLTETTMTNADPLTCSNTDKVKNDKCNEKLCVKSEWEPDPSTQMWNWLWKLLDISQQCAMSSLRIFSWSCGLTMWQQETHLGTILASSLFCSQMCVSQGKPHEHHLSHKETECTQLCR